MWCAVVGNGPSAALDKNTKRIEKCRFVVRMSYWRKHFPASESGLKCSAWAHYGAPKMLNTPGVMPYGSYEVWFTQPPSRQEGDNPGAPSLAAAKKAAWLRVVHQVSENDWQELRRWLEIFGGKGCRPTTGLTALTMALNHARWEGLFLTGFDATTPDKPGWGDNVQVEKWHEAPHDMEAEKAMIAQLVGERIWCGRFMGLEIQWGRLT